MIAYEDLKKLNQPFFAEFKQTFSDVLDSGWYILGEQVKQFEQEFATYCGAAHSVGVASGLDAITLSLMALQIPNGSEVIVPANSYIATVLAVLQAGLVPVLAEPTMHDANIDPLAIEKVITPKTKAILVVHLYGAPCNMQAICALAKQHQLFLVEDCAQAHGATYQGKHVGTFGEFGAFSFYPTKNLGALGDSGAIISSDAELIERCRMLRNYGESKKYVNDLVGVNSRLDEMQAAFLRIKLKKLNMLCHHKQKLAKLYYQHLHEKFTLPQYDADTESVYHIFPLRTTNRDKLKDFLQQNQIGSNIHYPTPVYQQKCMANRFKGEYPVSDMWHQMELSLPISMVHNESDILQVCEVLNSWSGA